MDANKKNIMLVPTDFSDVANVALNHAIMLAKIFNNEIAVLHINETGLIGGMFRSHAQADLIQEAIESRLLKIKENVAREHGITVHTYSKESNRIYKTIIETVEELGCDSIVMGTHGAQGIKQVIGSNSSRVISESPVPVIVIKESKTETHGYKQIVLPIDLTFETRQKVKWAIHLGNKFGSTIHILSYRETDEFLEKKIHANINKVEHQLTEAGIKFQVDYIEHKRGFAKETIAYAEKVNADLIMIMTQEEEDFSEFIIGSYAQQIVNTSPIPVMTVTPTTTGIHEMVRAI